MNQTENFLEIKAEGERSRNAVLNFYGLRCAFDGTVSAPEVTGYKTYSTVKHKIVWTFHLWFTPKYYAN